MFGKRKGPADTPFQHDADCKHSDAEPEWWHEGSGRWQRVCSCHTDYAYPGDGSVNPNSPAVEPSWRAHLHSPSCDGERIEQVVRVTKYVDGGWRSECLICTTVSIYWWDPDHRDRNDRPITREGMVAYQYELRHQLTGV